MPISSPGTHLLDEDLSQSTLTKGIVLQVELVKPARRGGGGGAALTGCHQPQLVLLILLALQPVFC